MSTIKEVRYESKSGCGVAWNGVKKRGVQKNWAGVVVIAEMPVSYAPMRKRLL